MSKLLPYSQTLLLLIFLSILVLSLDLLGVLKPFKQAGFYITNPITFNFYKAKQVTSKQLHFIFAARSAAQENKALQEQLGQLILENASIRRKLAENESLLAQTQSLDPQTYNLVSSRPIGLSRYLKIDKGEKDGLKAGQAVIFKENFIGQIFELDQKGASVRLPTDPDSKIAAFSIGKEGRAKGILIGQFGLEMLLDKILHDEKIEIGDLVYSEGTEGYLPRGLVLGRVNEVLENKNEIFKQAKIEPIFDIRDLELVFVILE